MKLFKRSNKNKSENSSRSAEAGSIETSSSTSMTVMPDSSYTLSPKRLAGSPACLNCGTELAGPFCHFCGQPDKNLLRFFPVLVRELLADFLDFDSRFTRTMKPLLFHPGKLTRDYLDGRRFRYTPPLRLYIFASMAFFLIATMLAGNLISIDSDQESPENIMGLSTGDVSEKVKAGLDKAVLNGEMTKAEAAELQALMEQRFGKGQPGKANEELISSDDSSDESDDADEAEDGSGLTISIGNNDDDVISFNDKPWDREANPFILPGAPDFINDWINNEIEDSPQKGREIEANPDIMIDKFFDVLPIAVFIMLPLVALLLKFWYLFSGHYYVEHLIHALHNHSFLFVIFIMLIIIDAITKWIGPGGNIIFTKAVQFAGFILFIWIPLYLLFSLKKVYQQGWTMTLGKYALLGVSYIVLLTAVSSAAALAGFVLL